MGKMNIIYRKVMTATTLNIVEDMVNLLFPGNNPIGDAVKEFMKSKPDIIASLWLKFRLVCKEFNRMNRDDLYRNLASIRACRLLYDSQMELAKTRHIYFSYVKCRKNPLFICSLCGSGVKHQNRSKHKKICPNLSNKQHECYTCNLMIHPIGGYDGRSRGFCPLKHTNCNYCDRTDVLLLNNLLTHHDTCGKILDKICFYCSKTFMRKDHHLHLTICKDKYRICDICKEKILVNNEFAESLHMKKCEDFMRNELNKTIAEAMTKILPYYLSIYNREIFSHLDMNLSGINTNLTMNILYEDPKPSNYPNKFISKQKSDNVSVLDPNTPIYSSILIFYVDVKVYPFLFRIEGRSITTTEWKTIIVYSHVINDSIDENNPKATQILELEKRINWPRLVI